MKYNIQLNFEFEKTTAKYRFRIKFAKWFINTFLYPFMEIKEIKK